MNNLKKLFTGYVKGNLNPQRKRIVDLWFDDKSHSLIDNVSDEEVDQFSQRIWEEFLKREKYKHQRHQWILRTTVSVAAIACVVLLIIFVVHPNNIEKRGQHEVVNEIVKHFESKDNLKKLTLADGSVVHMNKGTEIVMRKGGFNSFTREVWLEEGEAFFEVKQDPGRPFIVHTADGVNIRVIGTSFNIKAYRMLEEQVISVKTGLVQVSNKKGDKVFLEMNNKATFLSASQQITVGTTDGAGAADWRTGRIVLEHVSVNELAFRLKQYYNVELVNHAIPQKMELFTSFNVETPLEHVANNIAEIFGISYKIENGAVIFYSKN